MKILALLTPKPGTASAAFQPLIVPEELAVWSRYRSGEIRELYFQPDPVVVSLVFEAADAAAVHAALDTFPMVQAGLLDVRLVTLGPWLMFEALFDRVHTG